MPAYYIGEHKISNVALFDDYLAKVGVEGSNPFARSNVVNRLAQ
jgi:hypothetical protein